MADAIEDISTLTIKKDLANNQDIVDAVEVNGVRTSIETSINNINSVLQEHDDNYASTSEPTTKSEGKTFCDTTTDPALMKYYKDGASNTETLVGATLNQTITNKTYENPVFTPAGASSYINLSRNYGLKISNNSSNPTHQIDVTFDYMTMFDTNGRGVVESQTTALTLDLSSTGAGGRASSENSGAEKSSDWYYVYVYSDGSGAINGLLSLEAEWSTVITNTDNPVNSDYVRRVGAIRNDSSGDLLYSEQIGNSVAIETTTLYNAGSTTSTTWALFDVSSFCPETTYSISGSAQVGNATAVARLCAVNSVASTTLAPGVVFVARSVDSLQNSYHIPIKNQEVYVSVNTGTVQISLNSFEIII
jgi:hypothetical protein